MKGRGGLSCFLFLAAFVFYLHGAYPSVSVGDSGEFISAAHTLGIPHAPGYPAYTLLAHAFQDLIPFGNIAYRSNLFSAACGALAVVILFGICMQLSFSLELSLCAALIFMLGHALTVNAEASEVFALHAVFCGAVLWAALANQWLLAAFLSGLGLANHQTLIMIGPAVAFLYYSKPVSDRPSGIPLVVGLMGGLSVYLFLMIRAGQAPVMNAGNPDTLERFWRVLTRADYGSMTLALGETPERAWAPTLQQLERFMRGVGAQITWPGIMIVVIGIVWGIWKGRRDILGVTLAFLLIGPFFFLLGNLPFDAQSTGLLERFYIVPVFYAVILLAMGIQMCAERQRWIGWLAFLIPLALWSEQGLATPLRSDFRAYAYGRNNLRTLAPGTLFIMDGGDDTFYTLAYLTEVEHRRTDLELRDRGSVVFPGLYGADFRALPRDEKEDRRQQIERSLLASHRVLTYSTMNENILPSPAFTLNGMLYVLPHPASGHPLLTGEGLGVRYWLFYDLRGVAPWMASNRESPTDYRTRALLPYYAYQRSMQAAHAGQWADALGFAATAQQIGSDVIWLLPNLEHNAYTWAQASFQAGHLDAAEGFYSWVASWALADAAIAWSDLGAIEERRQKLDAAIADYQKAIQIDPHSEAAHYNLAVAYWKRSDWPNVIDHLNQVLAINPKNAGAQNYLAQAQAHQKAAHP